MSPEKLKTHPIWMDEPLPQFAALDRDLDVDVVVVGGGLTGITTTYLLQKEGVRVALIERDRLACGDTGRTTAHLTYVTDYRLHELASKFGADGARAFWEAGAAAIDEIERLAGEVQADCELTRASGYLHAVAAGTARTSDAADAQGEKERNRLREDLKLAGDFGFDAEWVEEVPYARQPGIKFSNQAKFHPRKYLAALVRGMSGGPAQIFEQTAFEEVEDEPFAVRANGHRIRCRYLVIATHNPLMGAKNLLSASLFQTKLALYTSYVLGARLPPDTLPEALFWDTGDPYDYLRIDVRPRHQYAIFGGCDVKTGQEHDAREVFQKLERRLSEVLPQAQVQDRWLGQVVETDDGLPFIGENTQREFIATGFCGNGFTLGTLSAMMARDRFLKRRNPWFDLFRVDRKPFHGGLWRYARENLDYPYYLVRDRIAPAGSDSLDDLPRGEGRLIKHEGRKVAAYRDPHGKVTLCSPVCTHLKCLVRWNTADRTWDCPCHGSRFRPTGEVISGPAEEPLEVLSDKS